MQTIGLLKRVKQSTMDSSQKEKGQDLSISLGNIVLLKDHSIGSNKIQDAYEDKRFVIAKVNPDPSMIMITPMKGKGNNRTVQESELKNLEHPLQIQENFPCQYAHVQFIS